MSSHDAKVKKRMKEKEKQQGTVKRPQQKVYFFQLKLMWKNLPGLPVQKYANKLIERKTMANSL